MYGRKRSPLAEGALLALSLGYRFAVRLRRLLFILRIFKARRLPRPVISVGNITLGGTGKTPAVITVAGLLLRNKRHPAVVSRGYGRENEEAVAVVSDGRSTLTDARAGGDEPVLLGSRLSGVPVVVGRDRYRAGLFTIQVFGPEVIVLDDGFQHLGLARDLDIVLVDAANAFGNGRLFPAGILREPLSALKRADVVVITRGDAAPDLEALQGAIAKRTKARIFTARHRPVELAEVKTGERMPSTALRGMPVAAFSGIARPASFRSLLGSLGADVRAEVIYPDHHAYAPSDLAAVFQKAADARASMIVTTEKDAVKLTGLPTEGIWALRIELEVQEQEAWEELILQHSA